MSSILSVTALVVVVAFMLAELAWSRRNERILLARGAVEVPDPVYAAMRWAYPGVFVLMAAEGAVSGHQPGATALAGAVLFTLGKALKFWAIRTLGDRWTYKVLVLPGVPLVGGGPYRYLRHPNYAGVLGELAGMALVTGAAFGGPAGTLFFAWLLRRRIRAEERALTAAAPGSSRLVTERSS